MAAADGGSEMRKRDAMRDEVIRIIDDDDVEIPDGGRVRVPLYLMDAAQRAVATDGLRLHDGMGNPAGHKRGYVFGGNVEHGQRAAAAYDERTKLLQNAWRNPAAAAERNEAELEAWRKPGAQPGLRQDATNDSAAAYAAYVERIGRAWRAI
jgi:hypothetical protein